MAEVLTMRERFERYAASKGFYLDWDRTEYVEQRTQVAWEAWQAAEEAAEHVYGVMEVDRG